MKPWRRLSNRLAAKTRHSLPALVDRQQRLLDELGLTDMLADCDRAREAARLAAEFAAFAAAANDLVSAAKDPRYQPLVEAANRHATAAANHHRFLRKPLQELEKRRQALLQAPAAANPEDQEQLRNLVLRIELAAGEVAREVECLEALRIELQRRDRGRFWSRFEREAAGCIGPVGMLLAGVPIGLLTTSKVLGTPDLLPEQILWLGSILLIGVGFGAARLLLWVYRNW